MKHLKLLVFCGIILPAWSFAQFSLPALPYKYEALEPYIDSTTMRIHHDLHHAAYVNNLNKALEKYPELYRKSLEELLGQIPELPQEIQTLVRNNGGGTYNHGFFWHIMAPAGTTSISARLEKILTEQFGSVDKFKTEFETAATTRFGSGWAWLVLEPSGKLRIVSTANQDNPLIPGAEVKGKPVLTLDVWEHAYYLKYQQKRSAYAHAFWQVVNWDEVDRLIFEHISLKNK